MKDRKAEHRATVRDAKADGYARGYLEGILAEIASSPRNAKEAAFGCVGTGDDYQLEIWRPQQLSGVYAWKTTNLPSGFFDCLLRVDNERSVLACEAQ